MGEIRCPRCTRKLTQVTERKVKLRLPIVVFEMRAGRQVCTSVCPHCRQDIEVPLVLGSAAQ